MSGVRTTSCTSAMGCKRRRWDSNPRQAPLERAVLPTELLHLGAGEWSRTTAEVLCPSIEAPAWWGWVGLSHRTGTKPHPQVFIRCPPTPPRLRRCSTVA
jgi:hypothetical protein